MKRRKGRPRKDGVHRPEKKSNHPKRGRGRPRKTSSVSESESEVGALTDTFSESGWESDTASVAKQEEFILTEEDMEWLSELENLTESTPKWVMGA